MGVLKIKTENGFVHVGGGNGSGGNVDQSGLIFVGKTASFYGDSLTEVNYHYTKGYHQWLKEILGLASYKNYGVSGYKISDVLNKVNSVNDTADIIFVMIGVNDVQFDVPLGSLAGLESGTVYGNLNLLCGKLREKYPVKPLVFITPHEQTRYPSHIGVSMYDVARAVKEVCERHSIVVYDNFVNSEICTANLSYWTTDRCHWNDKAHEMVGKNLAHFVRNTFRYIPGASQSTTTLNSITATFNQGNAVIYDTDTLDSLKQYLTVTAHYSNGTTATVTGYTLVGRLCEGTSTIAVSYGETSATFTVEVTHNSESGGESGDSGGDSGTEDTTGFVGKTFKMTGTRGSGQYYFTALVPVDSDFAKGTAVKLNVSGSNAVNMTSLSGGAWLYGDDSGACSNGAYKNGYSGGTTGSCVVDSNGNVIGDVEYTLNNAPATPYLKVLLCLSVTIPASFVIDQISVTVNGNEKEILDIGGFYSDETCELSDFDSVEDSGGGDTDIEDEKYIGKTCKITGNHQGVFNATAIVEVDSDCVTGKTAVFILTGHDANNLEGSSTAGMAIFTDNTGVCGNSAYTGTASAETAVNTYVSGDVVTVNAIYTLTTVNSKYLKIPAPLKYVSTANPASFVIDQISVIIDGKEKEIVDFGGFFSKETCTFE